MKFHKLVPVCAVCFVLLAAESAFASKIKSGTPTSNYGQGLLVGSASSLNVGGDVIQITSVTNSTNFPNAVIYAYSLPFSARNFTFTTPQSFTNVGSVGVFLPFDPNTCPSGCDQQVPSTALGFTLNCSDVSNCDVSGFNAGYVQNSNGTVTFTVGSTTKNDNLTFYVEAESAMSTVPEPGTMMLLGTGLLGIVGAGRRKSRV